MEPEPVQAEIVYVVLYRLALFPREITVLHVRLPVFHLYFPLVIRTISMFTAFYRLRYTLNCGF